MVPKGLCLKAFCHGNWNRTLDRQWGSVWQFLHPRDITHWGWSTSATWNTLRRHPTYTTPDMANWTGSALRELYFALLSGPGTCECHTATSPPPWLGPTRRPAGGGHVWNLQNMPFPPL
jgi:hypothetical protein